MQLEFVDEAIKGAKRTETARKRVRDKHENADAHNPAAASAAAADDGEDDEQSPYALILSACLRHGADPNATLPSAGMSAVLSAADAGAKGLLRALLDAKADATVVDSEARCFPAPKTSLSHACSRRRAPALRTESLALLT